MRNRTRRSFKGVAVPVVALGLVAAGLVGGYGLSRAEGRSDTSSVANTATAVPISSEETSSDELVAGIANRNSPSVVQINVEATQQTPYGTEEASGTGSGVIYTTDGYIVTNNHVVEGASNVEVAFADGTTERGEVVGTDPYTDLAVVKVERSDLPAAKFSEGRDLEVGQMAVAIGSPSGFQSTVTSGLVSGLHRELSAQNTGMQTDASLVDLIQTDAAISPGSSGGALIDRDGEIIGINVAYLPQTQSGAPVEGIGFAIPSYTVTSVVDEIIENGEATHPYLGISLADLTPQAAEQLGTPVESGALVANVEPGSPAGDAGLGQGDVITAIDSTKVEDSGDLVTALRGYAVGDTVALTYTSSNGTQREADVTLGSMDS